MAPLLSFRRALVCLAVFAGLILSTLAGSAQAQTAIVNGTVRIAGTSSLLNGINVQLVSTSNGQVSRSATTSAGAYSITNVNPGTYYLRTSNSAGYVDQV